MRYFVDRRIGCIAVRDSEHPQYDPDYPGLHSDTVDVVEYWHGKNKLKEPNIRWILSKKIIKKAVDICFKLNKEQS